MSNVEPDPAVFIMLLACVPLAFAYKVYLRITLPQAFGVVFGAAVLVFIFCVRWMGSVPGYGNGLEWMTLAAVGFWLFVVPFVVRLVRAWLFDDLKPEERKSGAEGVRAWLRGGNLFCAIAIPVTGWYGFDCSPWALLIVTLLALIARPLLVATLPEVAGESEAPPAEDTLKGERERVMRMLEEGKIKADDATELLSALAATSPASPGAESPRPPMTSR